MTTKDSWLDAAQAGPGSAAHPSGWRPDRILNRKVVNLLGTAAGSAGVVLIALSVFFGSPSAAEPESLAGGTGLMPQEVASTAAPVAVATPMAAIPAPVTTDSTTGIRTYAIALPELKGLPPDALSGTRLDVWVSWGPPLTRGPRLQKLLSEITLEKIASPALEGSPAVALLSVTAKQVSDLIWAHRYGELSVVMVPGS